MKRRGFAFALGLALLAGCGSDGSGEAGSDVTRVALLTQGPVSDAGWYAGGYEGLQTVGDELGFAVSHQQTKTPSEFDEALISYASGGYTLIFAHGFEYQDAALRVAPDYPETTIVVSGGSTVRDNVIPLIFQLEEATYLAGIAAGSLTRTGIVGAVGGVSIPTAEGTFDAFEAGVRAVNPTAEVLRIWIGSWDDVSAAKEAAVAHLMAGADILIHNTDGASFGVFQAVREARESGDDVYALGMNRDQNDVAPDAILGSAIIRIHQGMLEIARQWSGGTLPRAPFMAGGTSGIVDYVVNPELQHLYDAELMALIDRTRDGIRDGSIEIPRIAFINEGQNPG